MAEYLAPGVFVEEIDSGSKPIEGVGTNTAAFIGYAKSGEFNKPTFITNWTQFCQEFGEDENALVVALCDELKMSAAEILTAKKASRKGWMAYAQSAIQGAIRDGSNASGNSLRSFQDFLRKYRVPQSAVPYMEEGYLAYAVKGYYDNGGGRAYIIRIAREEDLKALTYSSGANGNSNGNGAAALPESIAQAQAGTVVFKALKAGTAGNDIRVEVEHVGEGGEYKLRVSQGEVSETIPDGRGKPLTNETVIEAMTRSKLVRAELAPSPTGSPVITASRPEASIFTLIGGAEAAPLATANGSSSLATTGAANGLANVVANDFIGDEAQRTGMGGMLAIEDINMVSAPDLMAGAFGRRVLPGVDGPGEEVLVLDDDRRQAILDAQCGLVAYCERMGDRMALLDPIPGLSPQEMRDTTLGTPYNCDKGQAAIYYPWIRVADPLHRGKQRFVPPSGHIAGMWARVGVERGVHKAPANEALMGAVAMEYDVSKGEQEILNPEGINCIRTFPGQGIRVWGARTLATTSNPSWKYVNVRRLFNYLEKSMERGLQWVVFEPNDQDLWGRVRRNLSAFLFTEWKEGKLFGAVPDQAFYVKCDAETNPQAMIDLGRLYVEIGINPVKPAEFVIVRMGQWDGGASTSEG